jgi:hypothetical protein
MPISHCTVDPECRVWDAKRICNADPTVYTAITAARSIEGEKHSLTFYQKWLAGMITMPRLSPS